MVHKNKIPLTILEKERARMQEMPNFGGFPLAIRPISGTGKW